MVLGRVSVLVIAIIIEVWGDEGSWFDDDLGYMGSCLLTGISGVFLVSGCLWSCSLDSW